MLIHLVYLTNYKMCDWLQGYHHATDLAFSIDFQAQQIMVKY